MAAASVDSVLWTQCLPEKFLWSFQNPGGEVAESPPPRPIFPALEASAGLVIVSRGSCASAAALVKDQGDLWIHFQQGT